MGKGNSDSELRACVQGYTCEMTLGQAGNWAPMDAIAYHELERLALAQTSCFKISLDYSDFSYTLTLYCNSYQNSILKSLLTRVEVFLS